MKKFILSLICLVLIMTTAWANEAVDSNDSSPIPIFCMFGWLKNDACKKVSLIAEYFEDKYIANGWPYKYYKLKNKK